MCSFYIEKKLVLHKILFDMKITVYLGTYGVYWYNLPVRRFVSWAPVLINDEVIKNAADSGVRNYFTKVRPFVLILRYDCFEHELLLMQEVRFFDQFARRLQTISTEKIRRAKYSRFIFNLATSVYVGFECLYSTCNTWTTALRSASLDPGFWGTGTW